MQRIWTLLAAAAAAAIATTALAQDVPATQGASEPEKARILALIEAAWIWSRDSSPGACHSSAKSLAITLSTTIQAATDGYMRPCPIISRNAPYAGSVSSFVPATASVRAGQRPVLT